MIRTFLVCFIVTFGLGAALYSRFAGLLLYLWFAIFRPLEWVWFDLTFLHPSLVIGAVFVIPCLATGVVPNLTHPLSLGCLAFLGTALLAQTNAIRPDLGWMWIDFFARLMLVTFLAIRVINTRRRFLLVVGVVGMSLGFHAAKGGLAYLLLGGVQFTEGLGGAYVDNGHYAVAITMVLPLMLACAQNLGGKWMRAAVYVAIPLSCLTVIATLERAGFLALVTAVLTYVLLQRKRARTLAALGVLVLIGGLLVPLPAGYRERVETISTYRDIGETSALSRFHFWAVAVDMAVAHPLGIGLRNFEPLYDTFDTTDGLYGRSRAVHSSYFQVLAENGFAGLAVYVFLLTYSFILLFRVRRRARDCPEGSRPFYFTVANALIVSEAAFVVGGAFQSAAHNDLTWYSFGIVAALDLLQRAELKGKATQEAAARVVHASGGLPRRVTV